MKLNSTTRPRATRAPGVRLCLALALVLHGPIATAATASAERDALLAKARHERDEGQRVDALARCQEILSRWPDDPEAQALNVALLTELGASTRAGELAASLRPSLSPAETYRLRADRVAKEIRWADGEPADPFHPYVEADKSVDDARHVADDPSLPTDLRQRAGFDLLVALARAGHADEAVARYDAFRKQGVTLPPYAERAAADALLVKRRPAEAVALYEDSIAKDPGPYDRTESEPRIGLMYAYLESGQTRKAFRTIDDLAAKEPKWVRLRGVAAPAQNQRKVDADLNAAAVRDYVEMHADAYARLEPLNREAPANAQLRSELGMVELARGWPRRARDDFDIALTLDPRDAGAYIGKANAARVLNDYAAVDADLDTAHALASRNQRVDRAQESWERERGWQFDIDSEHGKGSSPDFGDRDATTQATIASPLIDDHWRIVALGRYSTADLPEGEVRRTRAGVGVRGYAYGFEGYVQALPSTDRYVGKTAIEGGFNWSLSDHWTWAADYSTAGDDTPLRAQYYGISAKTLDTSLTWRASELTQARIGLSRDRFSDGNRRNGWLAAVVQRLHTAPNLSLDGGVEIGGSTNLRSDRPYFNPRRDRSYALTGRLQNLLGQFYDRSVTQRIDVAVGQYAERGYATDWMASVRYGQVIQTGPGFNVGWGLGWHNQPYDGRREHRVVLDLTLHWGE